MEEPLYRLFLLFTNPGFFFTETFLQDRGLKAAHVLDMVSFLPSEAKGFNGLESIIEEIYKEKEYSADGVFKDDYKEFIKSLKYRICQELLPSKISKKKTIDFIPKDRPFPTRNGNVNATPLRGLAHYLLSILLFFKNKRTHTSFY
jgi:hypothetical protein